jgi:hypothetical protein
MDGSTSRLSIALTLIGAALGTLWWWIEPFRAGGPSGLGAFLISSSSVAALTVGLLLESLAAPRLALVALALATLVGIVTVRVVSLLPPVDAPYSGDGERLATWLASATGVVWVIVSWTGTTEEGEPTALPERMLETFLSVAVALVFTGALWSLIGASAALFDVVGIDALRKGIGRAGFAYPCSFAALGYGLAVGRASPGFRATLRRLAQGASLVLLPATGSVLLGFLVVLPFTGLAPLWATGSATPLLLGLLAFLSVMLAVAAPPRGRLSRALTGGAVLTMPLYAGIAAYSTALRIQQHGLTPTRVFAGLLVALAAVQALGAAGARLRGGNWLASLNDGVSRVTAATAVGLAIVAHTPLADPWRLSADAQLARLVRGSVAPADFDLAALRFDLGWYGWQRFLEIERSESLPGHEHLAVAAQRVRAARNRFEVATSTPPSWADLRRIPSDLIVPEEALAALHGGGGFGPEACSRERDCVLLGVDLGGDPTPEICLVFPPWPWAECTERSATGRWRKAGTLRYFGPGGQPAWSDLLERFQREGFRFGPPRYRTLVVGAGRLELDPEVHQDPD